MSLESIIGATPQAVIWPGHSSRHHVMHFIIQPWKSPANEVSIPHALDLQLLARGDTVGAAARSPGKSAELQALAKQYPSTLKLVTLDVLDTASVAVGASAIRSPVMHAQSALPCPHGATCSWVAPAIIPAQKQRAPRMLQPQPLRSHHAACVSGGCSQAVGGAAVH